MVMMVQGGDDSDGDDVVDVSDLPDQGPIISGTLPRYKKGDLISANCSSSSSVPAATLNWFVSL